MKKLHATTAIMAVVLFCQLCPLGAVAVSATFQNQRVFAVVEGSSLLISERNRIQPLLVVGNSGPEMVTLVESLHIYSHIIGQQVDNLEKTIVRTRKSGLIIVDGRKVLLLKSFGINDFDDQGPLTPGTYEHTIVVRDSQGRNEISRTILPPVQVGNTRTPIPSRELYPRIKSSEVRVTQDLPTAILGGLKSSTFYLVLRAQDEKERGSVFNFNPNPVEPVQWDMQEWWSIFVPGVSLVMKAIPSALARGFVVKIPQEVLPVGVSSLLTLGLNTLVQPELPPYVEASLLVRLQARVQGETPTFYVLPLKDADSF